MTRHHGGAGRKGVAMISGTDTYVPSFEEYAAVAWSTLYRSAYLLAGNHADAEDLAQQTLIKAHRAWARVSASDSVNAYVRRILTNTFLDSRRPRARRHSLDSWRSRWARSCHSRCWPRRGSGTGAGARPTSASCSSRRSRC